MKKENDVGNGENIIKTRTYDLHITYDKYYQASRFITFLAILYNFISLKTTMS